MRLNRNLPSDLGGLFAQYKNCVARYDFQGAIEALQRAHRLDHGQ